jgi:hypothetical protein
MNHSPIEVYVIPRELAQLAVRLIHLHTEGLSYEGIAALLNAEGVPTPGGGTRWLKSSVDRLLHTGMPSSSLRN